MTRLISRGKTNNKLDVYQLIDLFVEMNFSQIENELSISQFKIIAIQIGYPLEMIDQVIELGTDEYYKLLVVR